MKQVKTFNVGDFISFPRHCFAPMRKGWNGWNFSTAQIMEISKNKDGRLVLKIEYVNENVKNFEILEKSIFGEFAFSATSDIYCKKCFFEEQGMESLNVNKIKFLYERAAF